MVSLDRLVSDRKREGTEGTTEGGVKEIDISWSKAKHCQNLKLHPGYFTTYTCITSNNCASTVLRSFTHKTITKGR